MIGLSDILKARILIVDDQEANVSLLEEMLRDTGYAAISSTRDPHEVSELHRKNRYDLILLDLQMPGLDGFQVMEGLKEVETGGYLPVIAITAQPGHKLRALKAGAKDFVSKPFDLGEVSIRVHNMLEVRLLHREGKKLYDQVVTEQNVSRDRLQALTASELRYRRLFESAKDGILILDAKTGMVDDVNPFLIALLGFSREQFLGKAIWELGFFKDVVANEDKFAELREKEFVRYDNLPLETVDGRKVEVEFVSNVYLVDGCKVIQCNVRDVSARRKAEEALRQLHAELEQRVVQRTDELEAANKELEAFSYSVSHDLRAPLRAVDGFSKAMLDDFGGQLPDEGRRYLQTIRDGAQRMGALIDDLLAFARLGRREMHKRTIDTGKLVRGALDELGAPWSGRQVEIRVGNLSSSSGDPALLKQVWLNLLSNALKYTSKLEKAVLEIGCMKTNGVETFFVRDNGTGFDMRYADKLFGVFQRLHRVEDYEGTGVGLAVVQRIVNRHGGRIWADAAVDRGANFYFTLGKEITP